MTSTVFTTGTVIEAPWLNDVNTATYNASSGITGATTRTLLNKLADTVSVKDFGAVGNGTTDDSGAIQAAINSLSSSGGTLYFPSATGYVVNTTVNVTSSNLIIDFNGQSVNFKSTFVKPGSGEPSLYSIMFYITGTNVTMINGKLGNGSYTDGGSYIWFASGANNGTVDNCQHFGLPYNGSNSVAIQTRTGTSGIRIVNNYFFNCAGSVSLQGSNGIVDNCTSVITSAQPTSVAGTSDQAYGIDGSDGNAITNCRVDRSVGAPVCGSNIGANTSSTNFVISGNRVTGLIQGVGIYINSSNYGVVTDNIISGSGYTTTGAWSMARITGSSINFVNNTFTNPPTGYIGRGLDAIAANTTIANNQFLMGSNTYVYCCIAIQQAASPGPIYVTQNSFVDATRGIYFDGITNNGNQPIVLSGNVYYAPMTTPYQGDGSMTVNAPLWISDEKFTSSAITTFGINTHKLFRPFQNGNAYKFPINTAQNYVFYSNEVPTGVNYATATWSVGDTVYNSAPSVGQPIGWKCTVAGTPGTWVAMANL